MKRERQKVYAAAGAAVLILCLGVFLIVSGGPIAPKESKDPAELLFTDDDINTGADKVEAEPKVEEGEIDTVTVDIKGEVVEPGVYAFAENKRVVDAVKKAGGVTETGKEEAVNLAERLYDEMVIYVPDEAAVEEEFSPATAGKGGDVGVSINQADESELQEINGVGPATAEAIVTYREENGRFTSKEELTEVSGIGPATLERMEDEISIH
ncbi:competence protein ComEA [Salsuginibacillus halophilus]|uniref:Competence protein ComEA n=1 Tax=Salsuginibacillus halophilus TaxID=517424 RepID=A0A2P8HFN1_9BACI|nr:helix-hairpin-helix domain-containing protein [Salsuginibacillus halophilus]PSL45048.1 competence protein ComEA [Salsuginibacillus halophilus]